MDDLIAQWQSRFSVPKSHPSLAGHFPNHPVVPAVVLLNEVESQVREKYPKYQAIKLNHAKFLNLVPPEQLVHLSLNAEGLGVDKFKLTFSLTNNDNLIYAKGQFIFSVQSEAVV